MKLEGYKVTQESVDKFFPKTDIDILGYESPIKLIVGQMRMVQEDNIVKCVQEQGVSVDKDELIKALRYDRDQYEKGYINGYNAKASEVAREVIKEVEQILTAQIINIEEDFYHGTAAHWDATRRDCYEEILVELAELKNKYTEGEG